MSDIYTSVKVIIWATNPGFINEEFYRKTR